MENAPSEQSSGTFPIYRLCFKVGIVYLRVSGVPVNVLLIPWGNSLQTSKQAAGITCVVVLRACKASRDVSLLTYLGMYLSTFYVYPSRSVKYSQHRISLQDKAELSAK